METYGFFGGCFNPVTNAHINLANLVVEKYHLDKLIFVPMGDKYQKRDLVGEQHRYEMLKIATNNQEKLEVSDIELNLPYSLTMLEAFKRIEEQYKQVKPYFIIGADNLMKLIGLPDFETLVKNYEYIVIERQGIQVKEQIASNPILKRFKTHFNILEDNPYEQISSTEARKRIKGEKQTNLEEMLFKGVYKYIKEKGLYY